MAADLAPQTPWTGPRIPPELIGLTVDALGEMKGSFQALLQVSLVSKQCHHQARKYLFEHVDLGRQSSTRASSRRTDGQRIREFLALLVENETLAGHVISLKVRLAPFHEGSEEHKESFDQAFPGILLRLRWLKAFMMESTGLLEWDKVFIGAQEAAIMECCSRPSLIRLEFQGFFNFPVPLVFSGPSLKKICLLNVSANTAPTDGILAAWDQRLKTLNFQNASSVIGPYALSRASAFVGLEALGLTVNNVLDMEILRRIVEKCNATLHSLSILYIPYHSWAFNPFEMAFLPQLTRMGLFVCPAEPQASIRCPGFIPTLIYDSLSSQRSLELLSIFITFRTASFPVGELTGFLDNRESWRMLDEHLTSHAANLNLKTVNLVIVVTIEGLETEDPEDRFEELESQLMDETRSVLARNVESGRSSISIDVRRHPRAQGSIV